LNLCNNKLVERQKERLLSQNCLDWNVAEQISAQLVVLGAVAEHLALKHLASHTTLNEHLVRNNRLVVVERLSPADANVLVG